MKVEVKKIRNRTYDCWGRPEYDDVYIVINEEGKTIYRTESDPTCLINELTNNS